MFGKKTKEEIRTKDNLISLLKSSQRENLRNLRKYLAQVPLLREFCQRGLIEAPYLFLDNQGLVWDYTPSFAEMLDVPEDTRGTIYTSILKDSSARRLRQYLTTLEPYEFRYDAEVKGKKKELLIKKECPITAYYDLSTYGGKPDSMVITLVPLLVSNPWFRDYRYKSVPILNEPEVSPEIARVFFELIHNHGKTADEILKIHNKVGDKGITKLLEELKKKPKEP
jgi:hypothetical protein